MPVPAPDPVAPARYRLLHRAIRTGRIAACHDISEGGLAVALAEMAIAGRLGLSITTLPGPDLVSALFSESASRFVCEVAATDVAWLAEQLDEPLTVLGTVVDEPTFTLPGVHPGPARHADRCLRRSTGVSRPTAVVLAAAGTNRDHDVAFALDLAGAEPRITLLSELIENPRPARDSADGRRRRRLQLRRRARRRADVRAATRAPNRRRLACLRRRRPSL